MKINKRYSFMILAAVTASAIAAPILTACSNQPDTKLLEDMVRPDAGNTKHEFLRYELKDLTNDPKNPSATTEKKDAFGKETVQSIDDVAKEALKTTAGADKILADTVSSVLTNWFKNIKNSKFYTDKFKEWEKDINEQWDGLVKRYKKDHGANWSPYLQWEELDPVGGNEEDWKRSKLFDLVNAEFDAIVKKKDFIKLKKQTNDPSSLMSPEVVNGQATSRAAQGNATTNHGNPNGIHFDANNSSEVLDKAMADFQEFIFDQYVREELPLITSMVLFKHENPLDTDPASTYFNITDLKSKGITVENTPSYKWQVFYPAPSSPTADGSMNATAKYNALTKELGNANGKAGGKATATTGHKKYVNDKIGGAIMIPKMYTDDSATLFEIKRNSVFNDAFTQYAAAGMYKFYSEVLGVKDTNVKVSATFGTGLKDTTNSSTAANGEPGTEIMSNFMTKDNKATGTINSKNAAATTSHTPFKIPTEIQGILNNKGSFTGKYNGVKTITDVVNIDKTATTGGTSLAAAPGAGTTNQPGDGKHPFIMTRDEAGVHIIGIDRLEALVHANTNKGWEGIIQEIKNTLLWRHMLSKNPETNAEKTTGFTIDLKTSIDTYYDKNRNEIIYKYLKQAGEYNSKETTSPKAATGTTKTLKDKNKFVFSDTHSNMDLSTKYKDDFTKKATTDTSLKVSSYIDDKTVAYLDKYLEYKDYNDISTIDSTIKDKILGLQTDYIGKIYGNDVLNNGVAGVLPYTRKSDANSFQQPTTTTISSKDELTNEFKNVQPGSNDKVLEQTFGEYDSLNYRGIKEPTKTTKQTAGQANKPATDTDSLKFSEKDLRDKRNSFHKAADTYVGTGSTRNTATSSLNLKKKSLTFEKGQYSQYLQVANSTKSDMYYAATGDRANNAIASYLSTDTLKNKVLTQKVLQKVETNFFDPKKFSFNPDGFTTPTQGGSIKAAAQSNWPTTNDDKATKVIRQTIQYIFNQKNMLPMVNTADTLNKYGSWTDYDGLIKIAKQQWLNKYTQDLYSPDNLELYKEILALQYAFGYEPAKTTGRKANATATANTLGQFTFDGFKEYLLDITKNNQKAAFVWVQQDRKDMLTGYGTTKDTDFSFKQNIPGLSNSIHGYGYQGEKLPKDSTTSSSPTTYATTDNKLAAAKNSMTTDINYWNYVPFNDPTKTAGAIKEKSGKITQTPAKNDTGKVGFMGIQHSGNSSLDAAISTALFDNKINVISEKKNKTGAAVAQSPTSKGTLYNYGSSEELIKYVKNITTTYDLYSFCEELVELFPTISNEDLKEVYENKPFDQKKTSLVTKLEKWFPKNNQKPKYKTNQTAGPIENGNDQFKALDGEQLANSSNLILGNDQELRYFNDPENPNSVKQVVVTQFNHKDVLDLFGLNKDGTQKATAQKPGIDWNHASTNGFLNSSLQAFIYAAYEWATSSTQYNNISFNEVKKLKISVYDRRINDNFGEEWVDNYKKEIQ